MRTLPTFELPISLAWREASVRIFGFGMATSQFYLHQMKIVIGYVILSSRASTGSVAATLVITLGDAFIESN